MTSLPTSEPCVRVDANEPVAQGSGSGCPFGAACNRGGMRRGVGRSPGAVQRHIAPSTIHKNGRAYPRRSLDL